LLENTIVEPPPTTTKTKIGTLALQNYKPSQ
jgi:hypothetical protein